MERIGVTRLGFGNIVGVSPPPGASAVTGARLQCDVMSAAEVATVLGISRNSVYRGAGRGEIPHRRVGRRIIFSRRAIVAWLDMQGRVAPEWDKPCQ